MCRLKEVNRELGCQLCMPGHMRFFGEGEGVLGTSFGADMAALGLG